MELLLYVSCQGQIAKAIRILGVDSKDSRIALVALSDSKDAMQELDRRARLIVDGEEDDNLIEIGSKQKMAQLQRSYGGTSKEREATRFERETYSSLVEPCIIESSELW